MILLDESVRLVLKKSPIRRLRQQTYYVFVNTSSTIMGDIFLERLKTVRERRGMSQADLAKKAGLQPTAISHFETGTRSPSFDNLRRLADALTVSTDYLMGRSDKEEIVGPDADSLFRDLDKLSEEDLAAMRMMKEVLLKRKEAGS